MYAADPNPPAKRADRKVCEHCEATPGGCASNYWLRGRYCCEACTGNHDTKETTR